MKPFGQILIRTPPVPVQRVARDAFLPRDLITDNRGSFAAYLERQTAYYEGTSPDYLPEAPPPPNFFAKLTRLCRVRFPGSSSTTPTAPNT